MADFPPPLPNIKEYPAMYVKTEDLIKRRRYFLKHKKGKFEKVGITVPSFLPFSRKAFYNFVEKIMFGFGVLRVFFAVDDDNILTVVFAPAKDPGEKEDKYYYLDNCDFVKYDGRAEKWKQNYLNIFSCLDGTYDKDSNSPTDTESIEYEMNNIVEIASEIKHQEDNEYKITGLRIWFSSYTDKDKDSVPPPKPPPKIIKKRLIVQLVLIYDNGGTDDVLYIDTLGEGRTAPAGRIGEFDTGNICPPRCQ
jgi:hypothetical protein